MNEPPDHDVPTISDFDDENRCSDSGSEVSSPTFAVRHLNRSF